MEPRKIPWGWNLTFSLGPSWVVGGKPQLDDDCEAPKTGQSVAVESPRSGGGWYLPKSPAQ